ncbi:MAG: recombinase family protein [Sulfurospirillaceae bacterium]|nr:recombinase family protein [Sulfurospirillaceae bacterium]MDD3462054.1 recombinase family protein [Sulfurospirillaceae bacterium]
MTIVLLKNRLDTTTATSQQKQILRYAHAHFLTINATEIENSKSSAPIEERRELKGFLRSLENKDNLLIYDIETLSENIDDLIKIFECLFSRSISIHVVSENRLLNAKTSALDILEVLSKKRSLAKKSQQDKSKGRPKGRMSKSKFDVLRPKVIKLLEENFSVNEIAKQLEVRRSSLKDYIHSRGLKELAKVKNSILEPSKIKTLEKKTPSYCSLIDDKINNKE